MPLIESSRAGRMLSQRCDLHSVSLHMRFCAHTQLSHAAETPLGTARTKESPWISKPKERVQPAAKSRFKPVQRRVPEGPGRTLAS